MGNAEALSRVQVYLETCVRMGQQAGQIYYLCPGQEQNLSHIQAVFWIFFRFIDLARKLQADVRLQSVR